MPSNDRLCNSLTFSEKSESTVAQYLFQLHNKKCTIVYKYVILLLHVSAHDGKLKGGGYQRKEYLLLKTCRYKLRFASLLTLLTPWSRVLLEKLTGFQLVKKFPEFYGIRRFMTAITSVRQLSLFWASSIQPMPPHPNSWRSILILSSHLHLGLPSGLFPSGFPTKTLYDIS
jgi:hypothetical protein